MMVEDNGDAYLPFESLVLDRIVYFLRPFALVHDVVAAARIVT